VFSGFIVVDTQQLTRNMNYVYEPNGHIVVAMTLFLDVVNLFMQIISIVNYFTKEKKNKKVNH